MSAETAAGPAAERVPIDPYSPAGIERLVGLVVVDGLSVTAMGDEGETFLCLGHHPAGLVARAFDRLAHRFAGESLIGGRYPDLDALAECVHHQWAVFLLGCTGRCTVPGDAGHWRAEHVTRDTAGSVAVSIL